VINYNKPKIKLANPKPISDILTRATKSCGKNILSDHRTHLEQQHPAVQRAFRRLERDGEVAEEKMSISTDVDPVCVGQPAGSRPGRDGRRSKGGRLG